MHRLTQRDGKERVSSGLESAVEGIDSCQPVTHHAAVSRTGGVYLLDTQAGFTLVGKYRWLKGLFFSVLSTVEHVCSS